MKGNWDINKNRKTRMKTNYVQKISQRTKFKIVIATFSFSFVLVGVFFYFYFVNTNKAYSAVSGDYRSITTGNWSSTSTWETYNGTSWVAAGVAPANGNNIITIQSGHIVSVTANVTVDQLVINTGGELNINSGKTLTLANGTGTDLTVDGTLSINGTLTAQASTTTTLSGTTILASGAGNTFAAGSTININSGGRYRAQSSTLTTSSGIWTVNSGGVFQAEINGPALPLATWNTGSTCEITGVTTTKPSNLNQAFNEFSWLCSGQTANLNLAGTLTTVNGNFNIVSTGTAAIYLVYTQSVTFNIGGNFILSGGKFCAGTESLIDTINIAGNFEQTGGTFNATDKTGAPGDAAPVINVGGDFILSGGTFDMTQNTDVDPGEGLSKLNISGNYLQSGGTLTETATQTSSTYGFGSIYFRKNGTQIFSKTAGTISNTINFTVNNGSILDLSTYYPTGSGYFTVSSGGALIMASPDGITSSGATGNVQVTGTRTYSSSANYTYDGTSDQVTGNGLPSTMNNLTIENASHVTLTNTASVSGILTLSSGQLITNSNEIIVTNSSTSAINSHNTSKYIRGNLRRYVNSTGSYDFPVGTSTNYELLNLNFNAMTGFANVLCSFVNANPINPTYPLTGITVNGTAVDSMLNYGYWDATPNSSMTSGSYSATLNERGHTNSAGTPASYCVLKRANSSSSWQSVGTHNNSTQSESGGTASAARSSLTGFSQFGIGKNSGVGGLPIQLINFEVRQNKDVVNLYWSTVSEINNDYFTIERSVDGEHFEELLRKPGAGNSTIIQKYTDADAQPISGTSFYRLKQTDYDGNFTYSKTKSVKYEQGFGNQSDLKIISIGPNPFSERCTLTFESEEESSVYVQLINSSGQVLVRDKIIVVAGINQYDFTDNKKLPPGIYIFEIENDGKSDFKRVVKK
jgi:hypothetical protein